MVSKTYKESVFFFYLFSLLVQKVFEKALKFFVWSSPIFYTTVIYTLAGGIGLKIWAHMTERVDELVKAILAR